MHDCVAKSYFNFKKNAFKFKTNKYEDFDLLYQVVVTRIQSENVRHDRKRREGEGAGARDCRWKTSWCWKLYARSRTKWFGKEYRWKSHAALISAGGTLLWIYGLNNNILWIITTLLSWVLLAGGNYQEKVRRNCSEETSFNIQGMYVNMYTLLQIMIPAEKQLIAYQLPSLMLPGPRTCVFWFCWLGTGKGNPTHFQFPFY